MSATNPSTRLDMQTGLVHVVAYDGMRFCGPFSWNASRFDDPVVKATVTCLFCMAGWRGKLQG